MIPIDVETHPFRAGLMAPPVIAVGLGVDLLGAVPSTEQAVSNALRVGVYGFAVAYDMACIAATWPRLLPTIFDAYESGRILDLRLRVRLADIRTRGDAKRGPYTLDALHQRYDAGRPHSCKDSPWRTRFIELASMAPEHWPVEARQYLSEDIRITRELYESTSPEVDEAEQSRYDFALRLMSVWGLRTTIESVDAVEKIIRDRIDALRPVVAHFFRDDGSKDMATVRDAVAAAGGRKKTAKGAVATDKATLRATGASDLVALADYNEAAAKLSREIPLLRDATIACHTRYDLVASGRTSSSGPNLQNLGRSGGAREAFVPRDDHAFLMFDYPALELRTFAQVLIALRCGRKLADALNGGLDPHLDFAASLAGVSYEAAQARLRSGDLEMKDLRQLAKAANFGFPGGLGAKAFRAYAAAAWGVQITEARAYSLREQWRRKWPEAMVYAQRMGAWVDRYGRVEHYRSGRVRGDMRYTAACNTMFQGLGGDVAKDTLYRISRECYMGAMRPSRPALFVHDEVVLETPRELVDEHARALEKVVRSTWDDWLPDVSLGKIEIIAATRWSKKAKRIVDSRGKLKVHECH